MISNRNIILIVISTFIFVSLINSINKGTDGNGYDQYGYSSAVDTIPYDNSGIGASHPRAKSTSELIETTYSQLVNNLKNGRVDAMYVGNNEIRFITDNGVKYKAYGPANDELLAIANLQGTEVRFSRTFSEGGATQASSGNGIVSGLITMLLIGGLIYYIMKRQGMAGGSGGGGAMGFGKSKARLISKEENKVKFADVAGIDEAKSDLEEVVEFLANPQSSPILVQRFQRHSSCWTSWHWQDTDCTCCRRRSRRSVLLNIWFRFC